MHNVPNGPTGEAMPDPRSFLARFHEAETARAALDPMLALIRAYEAERERFNASDEDAEEGADAHLVWLVDRLANDPPPIYTTEGAQAALRLVADDMDGSTGGFQEALVAAALAFLRTGRA